jgi:hypothetical protein
MLGCPYCGNEMKSGFVEGSGKLALIWKERNVESNKIRRLSRAFIQRITNRDCIVLKEAGIYHSTCVIASYCDTCKKIIISNVR